MNWFRFIGRGTSNLVRRDTASIELNVLTYVYGAAARLRFYSCYVCVPCASTACNAAADAQKHECNTHVHDRTMEWFVHSWALLWICAATHRTAFVLSSPSLNIWCVLSTHESIIAHRQHNESFACRTLTLLSVSFSMPLRIGLVRFVDLSSSLSTVCVRCAIACV